MNSFAAYDIPYTMTDSDDKRNKKPQSPSPFRQGGAQNRVQRRRSVPAFMKESTQQARKSDSRKPVERQSSGKKVTPDNNRKRASTVESTQDGQKQVTGRPVAQKPPTTPSGSDKPSTARSEGVERTSKHVQSRRRAGTTALPESGAGKQQLGRSEKQGDDTGDNRAVTRSKSKKSSENPFKTAPKRGGAESVDSRNAPSLPTPGAVKTGGTSSTTGSWGDGRGSVSGESGVRESVSGEGSAAGQRKSLRLPDAVGEKSGKESPGVGGEGTGNTPVSAVLPSLDTDGDTVVDPFVVSGAVGEEGSERSIVVSKVNVRGELPSVGSEDEAVLEESFESFLAELTGDESVVEGSSDSASVGDRGVEKKPKKTFADHYVGDNKRSKKSGYDKRKIVEKYAKKKLTSKTRERYKHFTEHNKVTGRQIEFFQNINLAHTYDKHVMADLLKPPVDMTAETREQKALRERLVRQALGGEEALKRNSRLRISPKDIEVMRFLARFQYATARHVSRIYAETEGATQKRLNRLRERGLVLSNYFYGAKTIYWLTEEGMLLSGYDYKVLHQEKDINLQSFPHRFGLNHLAANIMGANVNVLDLDDFPQKNRESVVDGSMIEGETLVSEYEIHSTLARKRGNMRGEIYKPQIISENRIALREWAKRKRDGLSDEENPPPEFMHGNEYMFALYPREVSELVHHIPDLVVKRPRDPSTGAPRSIAVELELNVKRDKESYKRTMLAYKTENMMLKEVVWISPEKDIRTVLERAADEAGLTETGRVRILPLYVENGIFVNMNMWQL